MNILASFPIYNIPEVTQAAISSLEGVDTYFVVNTPELAWLVATKPHVVNKVNNYCNGGWNQAMRYFLKGQWQYLALGCSDVIMQNNWQHKIPQEVKQVWVPTYAPNLELMQNWAGYTQELFGGVAGAFTVLPRAAVELVYPIPRSLKLWFGDEWMYSRLRKHGWKVMQADFCAFHYGSLSIYSSSAHNEVIEADKRAWEKARKKI